MKKIFIVLCASAILYACGGGGDKTEKKDAATTTAKEATSSTNQYEDQALAIIGKSDCMTCHKINETSTGPAWKDVAKKYEHTDANVKMLAGKILKGGSGNWGTIPMTGHPALTEEEATTLANYVLALK
ncbi:MAG: c-type cytochrome [Sphingobacteriales bacterium]|nr:MAG: c-type cytochrome [Sphingobacteriales bacterium]